MEQLLILFVLGLVVIVLVLPFSALASASAARRRAEELGHRVDALALEIARLKLAQEEAAARIPDERRAAVPAIPAQPLRMAPEVSRPVPAVPAPEAEQEPTYASVAGTAGVEQKPAAPSPVSGPPPPLPPVLPEVPPMELPTGGAGPRAQETPAPVPASAAWNWEQFMGVKLFAWLGGLALFLAVAYFVKYSFDHDLIPPAVRVALGFLVGMGLLYGGRLLQQRAYEVTSQTLCGTGIVILYAATFAGHAFYHLPVFTQAATLVLMTLITATAFLLSVRMNAVAVATLGMLGGFLTPVLLSTGEDNPAGLFGYIALLDVGLLAVALRQRWPGLGALGAAGTVLIQIAWLARFFTVAKGEIALVIFLGFDVLFLIAAALGRRRAVGGPWLAGAASGLALVTMGLAFYFLSLPEMAQRPGMLFSFVFGADLCLLALIWLQPELAALQLVGGGAAFGALALWTGSHVEAGNLHMALGLCFLFALLHTVFPITLTRVRRGVPLPAWSHLFPVLALGLVLIPVLRLTELSLLVWPVVLAVDVLAIVLALATAAIWPVAAAMGLTLLVLGGWLAHETVQAMDLGLVLLLVGGFGVFFAGVAWYGGRWLMERTPAGSARAGLGLEGLLGGGVEAARSQLAAMSVTLPFLLLMLVVVRLPLPDPSPVFGLGLLLVILLLGMARVLRMEVLPPIGLVCVLALEHTWHLRQVTAGPAPWVPLGWALLFTAVFVVFPFLFRARIGDQVLPWAAGALAAPLHFYLVHRWVLRAYPNDFMGLIPALLALPMLACLLVIVRDFPVDHVRRNTVLALFGGAALFFITLIFPIQFERQWITIGWALEGAALCWLYGRVPHPGLRWVGVGLLGVAFVRLALNPAVLTYHPRTDTALWNWYLYAYGLVAVSFGLAARFLAPPRDRMFEVSIPGVLNGLGIVLVFLLINIEIADYFADPGQAALTFQFSGNFGRDMTYTIAWAVFALGLVFLGLLRRSRAARYAGLGLLAVTLVKLFFHDLAHLKQLYRIGALAGVAVVAILASFLYQKYQAGAERSRDGESGALRND